MILALPQNSPTETSPWHELSARWNGRFRKIYMVIAFRQTFGTMVWWSEEDAKCAAFHVWTSMPALQSCWNFSTDNICVML